MTRLTLAWALALSCSLFAMAQDPVITKAAAGDGVRNVGKAAPGSALAISGSNFGTDFDKVRVEIGGKECIVTGVEPSLIFVLTPQELSTGKTELVVSVSGKKAKYAIEVVKQDALDRDAGDASGAAGRPAQIAKPIMVETIEAVTVAGGQAFRVRGASPSLVDEMSINLAVSYGDKRLSVGTAKVKTGRFEGTLEPLNGVIPPGVYFVEVTFRLSRQPFAAKKAFMDKTKPDERKDLERFVNTEAYDLGDPAEAKSLKEDVRKKYQALMVKLDKTFDGAQSDYAATARSMFRTNRKLDDEAWSKWLFEQGFVAETKDVENLKKNTRYLKGPYLDSKSWEARVKKAVEAANESYKEIETLGKKYVVSPFPALDKMLLQMAQILVEMEIFRSRELFKRNEVKFSDDFRKEMGADQIPTGSEFSSGEYRRLHKRCERILDPTAGIKEDGSGE